MGRKRVMVIVYYWPPLAGSGVQRWLKMTKYFPDFGVQPVVVTPSNPYYDIKDDTLLDDIHKDTEVIKLPIFEPYKLVEILTGKRVDNSGKNATKLNKNVSLSKRLQRYIRRQFMIPDPRKYWARPTANYLVDYLKDNPVDAIITSGPPHSLHLVGLELKKRGIDIPWFADFRDPLSHIDFLKSMGVQGKLMSKYKKLEREILETADKVTGTTASLPLALEPFDVSKYHSITNGFDKADFTDLEVSKGEKFIFHAGLINEFRNPVSLWKALDRFNKSNTPIRLKLAGTINEIIIESLKEFPNVYKNTDLLNYISHEEVLKYYQKSLANLLLINNTDNAKFCIPGKLFELLAANKPIIAIGNKDSDSYDILKNTVGGNMFDYDSDPVKILEYIESLDSGIQIQAEEDIINQYDRKNLTKKYLDLIYK